MTTTTRARAAEIAEVDAAWRDRVELLVIEANGASSRVLCVPFDGDDAAVAPAVASAPHELRDP